MVAALEGANNRRRFLSPVTSAPKAIACVRRTEVEVPVGKIVVDAVVHELSAPQSANHRHALQGSVEEIPFHVRKPMAELECQVMQDASGDERQCQLGRQDEPSHSVVDEQDHGEQKPGAGDVL